MPTECMPPSGNSLIDHQHRELNQLIRAAAEKARQDPFGAAFAAAVLTFRQALCDHFLIEGVIYRGAGYPGSRQHNESHAAILDRVDGLVDSLPTLTTSALRHGVVDEMEHILFDHELLEDCAYWEVIRGNEPNAPIEWQPSLELGIAWIDRQHRNLFTIVNEMVRGEAESAPRTVIDEVMGRFLLNARQHFADEERELSACGRPVTEHRHEHMRQLAQLEKLAADAVLLANDYLRFWLLDHIGNADRRDFGTA
jgi:hemerythrin